MLGFVGLSVNLDPRDLHRSSLGAKGSLHGRRCDLR